MSSPSPSKRGWMRDFKMDLHIHTCLSPCSDETMLPGAVIEQSRKKNLDGIGICDHNSAENVMAVKKAGEREGIYVFGGLEITSSEEVHVLALFEDTTKVEVMQNIVYRALSGENDENYFGRQFLVDEHDHIIGSTQKLLIGSSSMSVNQVVSIIHHLGGIAIAAHIDRESFSIIGQLGFIPEELSLDAVELSPGCEPDKIVDYKKYGFPLVRFSDAHLLPDIGKTFTTFYINEPSLAEILKALRGIDGRTVRI